MVTKVQRWGNSLGLRIPRPLAREAGLDEQSSVELTISEGALRIRPVEPRRYDLDALLARVTPRNRHEEQPFGAPAGREVW